MAEDLRWLGLDWDLGWPEEPGCRQGLRTARYEAAFEQLRHSAARLSLLVLARGAPRLRAAPRRGAAYGLQVPLLHQAEKGKDAPLSRR